jgi:hypothetical protein
MAMRLCSLPTVASFWLSRRRRPSHWGKRVPLEWFMAIRIVEPIFVAQSLDAVKPTQ